ncbi:MAG: phasin family protein [Sulfuricellaceae bacterium]|nr:phasin family protein [Sulfuricellaceae bacterium]
MYKLSEQFTSTSKAGVESFVTMANATFAGFERLAALNLDTARSLLEDNLVNTRALLTARDLQALVSLHSTRAQPGPETAAAYSHSVYEIATETQGTLSKVVKVQVSELNKKLGLALDKVVKTAPAGSDLAVNAMRTALSAANSVYDSMSKAAKQAADIAEANFAVAASVAVRNSKKVA